MVEGKRLFASVVQRLVNLTRANTSENGKCESRTWGGGCSEAVIQAARRIFMIGACVVASSQESQAS